MKFKYNYISKIGLLWLVVATMLNVQSVKAQSVTEGFDDASGYQTLPKGWDYVGNQGTIFTDRDFYKKARPSLAVAVSNNPAYLITPMLEGEFSFYLRNYTSSKLAEITAFACTYVDGKFEKGEQIGYKKLNSSPTSFQEVKFSVNYPTRVALLIQTAYFDDFTYTPATAASGPVMTVIGHENGSSFDFGTVNAGTKETFVIANKGTADLKVTNVSVSGKFILSDISLPITLAPNEESPIIITTPEEDATGKLTIESDDEANSRYIIYLTSTLYVPRPKMEVDKTAVDFGKVSGDASETITVKNTGKATLTLTITSDSKDFTVEPGELTIEPDDEAEFTITYKYEAGNYGDHEGNITLKPNYGEEVVVVAKALTKDPDIWEEDFEEGKLPEGWSTDGWRVQIGNFYGGNKTYMAYAGTDGNTTITTPRLYAQIDQVLQYEVGGSTDSNTPLTVEYSHDNIDWLPYETLTEGGYKKFKAPETGYYYLRFQGRYGSIDNFEGFKLALKDHDVSITKQNIPTEGFQYADYTAKVTVSELLGKEEEVTADLYVGDTKVASETQTIGSQNSKEFTLTFMPKEAATNPVPVKVVVTFADNETVSTEDTEVTFKPAPLWNEEGESVTHVEGTIPALVFKYTAVPGWNTIAVPFALTDEYIRQIFGNDCLVYELNDHADGIIKFHEATKNDGKYVAGFPYVVYLKLPDEAEAAPYSETDEALPGGVILRNVKVEQTVPQADERKGVTHSATFTQKNLKSSEYIMNSENGQLENAAAQKAYHGYMALDPSLVKVPEVKFYDGSGEELGVGSMTIDQISGEVIYNLNGQQMRRPLSPGIYIINGKKTVVR